MTTEVMGEVNGGLILLDERITRNDYSLRDKAS